MKAFVVICTCAAHHEESNVQCPVERVLFVLNAHGLSDHVHDVLDVQPVFDHKDVKP